MYKSLPMYTAKFNSIFLNKILAIILSRCYNSNIFISIS